MKMVETKKIMLAAEDEAVRKMVARVLESVGYTVTQVSSSRQAVEVLVQCQPDLAILDLPTPDREGWAAMESVARLQPGTPVVALTTWSNQQDQARRVGVAALFEKPLDPFSLLASIRELLTGSQRRLLEHSVTAPC